jgi:hypothetical protein
MISAQPKYLRKNVISVCKYKGVTNKTGKLRTKICVNVKCESND